MCCDKFGPKQNEEKERNGTIYVQKRTVTNLTSLIFFPVFSQRIENYKQTFTCSKSKCGRINEPLSTCVEIY